MKPKGFKICHIGGTKIVIDYSWPVVFFLLVYSFVETFASDPFVEGERRLLWTQGFVAALLVFISILIHELAHFLVCIKRGVRTKNVRLFIFGGTSEYEPGTEPVRGGDELLIALAGPAVSLLLGIFLVFASALPPVSSGPAGMIVRYAAMANLALGIFNLLPGLPLDGGRIAYAFLWDFNENPARAAQLTIGAGNVIATSIAIFGAFQTVFFRDFISGIWCVFVAFLMQQASKGTLYYSDVKARTLPRALVRHVMKKNVVTVDQLTTVNEFVEDYLSRYFFTEFPVFDQDVLAGMVTIAEVKAVPVKLRNFKQVRDIMIPLEEVAYMNPDDELQDSFERMVETEAGCMPVIEGGRLVGIVARRDVTSYFQIKAVLEQVSPD